MPTHVYGNGTTTATSGANTITHFYDRAGIKAANRVNVFQQFADRKHMKNKMGKTFKISKWLHMYDRSQDPSDPAYAEFLAKGFMTSRSYDEVSQALSNAALPEGAGPQNKRVLKKVTFETSFSRYGEMIDYTDEVELFSEDPIQVRYREELGELANSRNEDLIMLDMLSTGTVIRSGSAISDAGIGAGTGSAGTLDDNYKVSYDLVRLSTRKLLRNRAVKNTSVITGSTKVDTRTVARAYYAIVGAEVKADLEVLTRGSTYEKSYVFVPVHQYAAAGTTAEGEIGGIHEVRFIEAEGMPVYEGAGAPVPENYVGSLAAGPVLGRFIVRNTDASPVTISGATTTGTYPATIDAGEDLEVDSEDDMNAIIAEDNTNLVQVTEAFNVYPILFPSQDAFATVGLKGRERIKFLSSAPSNVNNENPYGTKGFFSYNFFYAGILLKEECVLKVLVGASA